KEARAADDVQMTEVAGLALEVDYLMVYGVRVASEEDALCYCLFGCDRPEGRSILGSGLGHDGAASFSGPRLIAVNLGGGLRRRGAGQESRHLWCCLEARIEEPQDLAPDPHSLLVGVADVDHGRVGEHLARGRRQARLTPRLLIGFPRVPGSLWAAQHQGVDDAAAPTLGRRPRIAGRRPEPRHRLLVRARPNVDVPMREVFALPAEWTFAMSQRLGDEIDALPHAILILHGIAVVGGHLAAA